MRLRSRVVALGAALVAGSLVAACGGGRGAANAPVPPSVTVVPSASASPGGRAGSAVLRINIPQNGIGTSSGTARRPRYVSPATASLRVIAAPGGTIGGFPVSASGATVLGTYDLTTLGSGNGTGASCAAATGLYSRTCTIAVPIPVGFTTQQGTPTIDLAVETYAAGYATIAQNAPGTQDASLLSEGIVAQTAITQNAATTLAVVLGGVPAGATPITLRASSHNAVGAQRIPVAALDAAGNVIVGPYFATLTSQVVSNTPDVSLAVTSANGSGASGAVVGTSGSSDVMDLVYTGKGALTAQVQLFGATTPTTLAIANIGAIDEYDQYGPAIPSVTPLPLPASLANFQPVAIATGQPGTSDAGNVYVLSAGSGAGAYVPALARFAFSPSGTAVTSCFLQGLQANTFSTPMVIAANNAFFWDTLGNVVVAATTFTGDGGSCTNSWQPSLTQTVVGAAVDTTPYQNVWAIDGGGFLAAYGSTAGTGSATPLSLQGSSILATSTQPGPLVGFHQQGTGLQNGNGIFWYDATATTLNVVDADAFALYREASGYTNLSFTPQAAFVDRTGSLDLGDGSGTVVPVIVNSQLIDAPTTPQPTPAPPDDTPTPGPTDTPSPAPSGSPPTSGQSTTGKRRAPHASRFRKPRDVQNGGMAAPNFSFGNPIAFTLGGLPPTAYVDGAEGGGTLYGIVALSSQGLLERYTAYGGAYGSANTNIPSSVNAPYAVQGAALGGDGRIWWVGTANGTPQLFVFPGNGTVAKNSSKRARAPAPAHR